MNPTINTPMYKLLWLVVKVFVHNARVRYAKRALDRAFRRIAKMTHVPSNCSIHSVEIAGITYVRISDKKNVAIFNKIIEEAERILKQEATNG